MTRGGPVLSDRALVAASLPLGLASDGTILGPLTALGVCFLSSVHLLSPWLRCHCSLAFPTAVSLPSPSSCPRRLG